MKFGLKKLETLLYRAV